MPTKAASHTLRALTAIALAAVAFLSACASMPAPSADGKAAEAPKAAASAPASPASAATAATPAASAAASTASAPARTASAAAATASAPASAASRPAPDPTAPKPFAEITKDAKETKGFVSVWTKEEKTWLEIPEALIGKPILLSANISNSVGERGLYASQMGPGWMVEFRRVGNTVQLIAMNDAFRAPTDKAMATAVRQSFSNSMLAAGPLASAPHPERKSLLVDASLFLADIPNYAYAVEAAFRTGFGLDRPNSHVVEAKAEKDQTVITTNMHFSVARIPLPPVVMPGAPPSPVPIPTPPRTTPDPRSFFIGYVYTLAALPEKLMAPRIADPRLGHFAISYTDLANESESNRVHMIKRWRLEKKEPKAAMSEPVTPITYWLDKNIPTRYRKTVMDATLEWNKAFEAIGFKNAIIVKQQPDDATWDNMDAKHASIRWFTGADVGFAIGPSRSDPRTGEILDADIGMSDVFSRSARREISSDLVGGAQMSSEQRLAQVLSGMSSAKHQGHSHLNGECIAAEGGALETQVAMDILEGRGELHPNSPEAEAFVQAYVKWVIMHEVGHTLGFKHNFKGSASISPADLRKPGITINSVMDYPGLNIPLQGEAKGNYHSPTLGAYDYWAVAYAYSQFTPEAEKAGLEKIAARSTEPALAFADDADLMMGVDPNANLWDLSSDPLNFYERRLKISQELWAHLNTRKAKVGDDPQRTRRSLNSGFNQLFGAVFGLSKFVGGMHTVRDLPGTTDRSAYKPIDPAKQRQALQFVTNGLFKSDSFKFSPALLSSLGTDNNEWTRAGPLSVAGRVAGIQSMALDQLMSARTMNTLLDLPQYLEPARRKGVIGVSEVFGTVQGAVWQELNTGADTDRVRRNLQRDHLRRLTNTLTKGGMPGDAQAIARVSAQSLQAQLQRAVAKPGKTSAEHQAHLKDSLNTLTEALKATMSRAG